MNGAIFPPQPLNITCSFEVVNMTLTDLVKTLGFGLILACSGAGDTGTASGCKNDSECKGNRICIDGECVEENGNTPGKDTYSSLPDTYNLDTSQNCTSHFKKVCSDGDIYWKDSCGNLEDKLDNCAYGCSNGKCSEPGKDTFSGEDSFISDVNNGCSNGEYTCNNGKCIPKDYVCDGEDDCNNGEDEKGCSVPQDTYVGNDTSACEVGAPCEVEGSKKCAVNNVTMLCTDQGNGCLGYIGVQDCEEIGTICENGECIGSGCSSSEYICNDGGCIPKDYVCDGTGDCSDQEDEDGCCVDECYQNTCVDGNLYVCEDDNGDGCSELVMAIPGCGGLPGMYCEDGDCKPIP